MSIKIAYLSLANAARNQDTELRLGKRFELIIEHFQELRQTRGVDMFMLTEGRLCKNPEGEGMMDAWDIAYGIAKRLDMIPVVMPNQGMNKMAFCKIAIYDPTKLFLLSSQNYYTGESLVLPSGPQFCQCVSGLKFHRILPDTYDYQGQCKNDSKLIFNVGMIQTPVRKDSKDNFFQMMVGEFSDKQEPWIFPGDYNLYNEDSDEQRALLDSKFINMTPDIGVTFVSFPHDLNPQGEPYRSSLDRFYVNQNFVDAFGDNISVTAEPAKRNGVRLSEHHLLSIDITF